AAAQRVSVASGGRPHPGGASGEEPGRQRAVPPVGSAEDRGTEPAQQDQSPGGTVRLPGGKEPDAGGFMSIELQSNLIALQTIVQREVRRFTRIWAQTLLPPGITMVLYFVIFGSLIGRQIGD